MMQKAVWSVLVMVCLFPGNVSGQSSALSQFFRLSLPEIWWVAGHPFSAPEACFAAQEVRRMTDSLRRKDGFDRDIEGGRLDAFNHIYWMARMGQEIKLEWACKLGVAHEQGNKIRFFRNPSKYYLS